MTKNPTVPIDVPKTAPTRPMTPLAKPSETPTGALQLIVRYDDGHWSGYPIDKPVVKVGRRPDNDIILPDQCVSGYHAEFRRLPDGEFELFDCDSYNGTAVNGGKIKSRKVGPGDFVVFGILQTIVENGKSPVTVPDAKASAALAVKPVSDGEREKLNRELDQLRLAVEKLNGEKSSAQASLDRIKAEQEKITKETAAQKTSLDAMQGQLAKAQQDLKTIQTELPAALAKKAETDQQLAARQKELADLQTAIASAGRDQERIKTVQKELAQKEQELTFFVNRLNVAKTERDQTLAESREYRDILANFEARRARLEESISELEAKASAKQEQVATADAELAKTQAEWEAAKRSLAMDRNQDEALRNELNMSKDEIQKLQQQIGAAKNERDEIREETKDIGFKSGRFFMPVLEEAAKQPSPTNAG